MLQQTTTDKEIRFKSTPNKDKFVETLRGRINQYFKDNKTTPYANGFMWFTAFFGFTAWAIVYYLIISNTITPYGPIALIGAFTLLGYINIFIAFNVSHDALHNAYSRKAWINKLLSYSFDFIGGNSYLFGKIHTTHHMFSNIHGIDPQMESHGLLRNTPHERFQGKHRLQFIYVILIYALAQLHWIVIKDFKWMFFEKHIGNEKNIKHPPIEIFKLIFWKALYYTLNLVIPLLVLTTFPWWIVVLGFVAIHILPGLTFALIFQSNHVFEGTTYPVPNDEGDIENCFAIHTLETTLDFARKNKLATWLMGGINVHVIHHMFPGYCHIHSASLAKILIKTCKDFDLKYMEAPTFGKAVSIHIKMLKHLSNPEAKVASYNEHNHQAMHIANH